MMARSSGAIRSSAQPSRGGDQLVELGAVLARPRSASSRVNGLASVEQLVKRPAGHLALVEREHGVAALIGAAHAAP